MGSFWLIKLLLLALFLKDPIFSGDDVFLPWLGDDAFNFFASICLLIFWL